MWISCKRGEFTDLEINTVAKRIFELPDKEAFSKLLLCSMEFKRHNLACNMNGVPIKNIRDQIIKFDSMDLEEEEYNQKIYELIKNNKAEERAQFLKVCFISARFPNLRPSREYRDLIHKYMLNDTARRNRGSCFELPDIQSCKKIKNRFFSESCNSQIRFEILYTLLNRCNRMNCHEADTGVCCIRCQGSASKGINDLKRAKINHIISYIGLSYLEKTALFLEMIDSENQFSVKENLLFAILDNLTLAEAF